MIVGSPTILNLVPGGVNKVVHVNQVNDNIEIQFQIMNGSQPYNVTEGVSCTIRGTKGDSYGYTAEAATTVGSNVVTVTLTEQLTAVAGGCNVFELVFVGAENSMKVSTENFILAVERAALGEDTVISDSDLAYAAQVLDQLQSVGAVNAQVQQNKANIAAEVTRATAAEQTLQQNINSEASARQSADNTLQSNINVEASARATQDNVLQAEIDQLVAPSGSAPSAAEVTNARIGADGTTYDTLGNAIRGQVTDVKSQITKELELLRENIFNKDDTTEGICETNGTITTNSSYRYTQTMIPVNEGDVLRSYYEAANHSIYTANMTKVCAFNSSGEVVTASGQDSSASFYTVPSGIKFVKITFSSGVYATAIITVNDSTAPSAFVPYAAPYYIAKAAFILNALNALNVKIGNITKDDTDFWQHERSANLFNKSDITEGIYFNANGSTGESQSFFISYVQINGNGTYSLKVAGDFYGLTNAVKIPCFDKNKSFVKTIVGTTTDTTASAINNCTLSISEQDISDGVFYIGYSEKKSQIDGLMIVKSATYPSAYIEYYDRWTLPDLYTESEENPLIGKTAVFDGDSICSGNGSAMGDYGNGWAGRIGVVNGMTAYNVGVSGACITAETYSGTTPRHWISRYIDTIHTNYPDADYIILEGGTNDADNFYNDPSKLGTFNEADFTGPFNDTTFYGAMDSLCKKALTYFPKAKIGFIIAQKMGLGFVGYCKNRYDYFTYAEKVCKKWGIPVLNLWDEGQLRPDVISNYNPEYNTIETATAHGLLYYDGQHLTAYGYDVISPKIAAWMKTL